MPKIPLYAKGVGPTVKLPTGGLSPRLSERALQAPGQALVRFGEQVGAAGQRFAETQLRIDEGQMKAEKTRQLNEI